MMPSAPKAAQFKLSTSIKLLKGFPSYFKIKLDLYQMKIDKQRRMPLEFQIFNA